MKTIKIYLTAIIIIAGTTLIANIPPYFPTEHTSDNTTSFMEDCSYMSNSFEEKDINDIPFNTAEILLKTQDVEDCSYMCCSFEEDEIQDIPFNTEKVIYQNPNSHNGWKLGIVLEKEEKIDDIPFNTRKIFKRHLRIQKKLL
ncbi:MAG: hypothetical protein U9R32_01150 [Bacteroidota bacterium]|nr:hypothetical protein [Bacteroidota bacterium]